MYSLFFTKNEGFSLVEAMAGIVILTIALFPALGYFANSVGFVHQTEIRSQAMDMAADTMEYFKMEAQNNWSNINTTADNFSVNNGQGANLIAGYKNFTDDYIINVYLSAAEVVENNKKITVTVYWDSGDKNVKLTSLLRGGG